MGRRKTSLPLLPTPPNKTKQKFLNLVGMLSSVAVPGVGRQDSGYPGLCYAGWIGLECSLAA